MLRKELLQILLLINYLTIISTEHYWFDKNDAFLQVDDLLLKYGYNSEKHTVATKDGYILQLNRIINKNQLNNTRPAVLVYHGMIGYAGVYLINGKSSLGFYLSDNGYDVWLGNVRGSRYSNKHKTLDSKRSEYWNFDWHEMGVEDLPASIDYIIKNTGQAKINYIGHSQGTTIFFVLMSELPEYNEKIIVMNALAPIMSVRFGNFFFFDFPMFSKLIKSVTSTLGYDYIPMEQIFTPKLLSDCSDNIKNSICDIILRIGIGHMKKEQTAIILSHSSASPLKCAIHYLQLHESGKFQKYDYGSSKNLIYYGKSSPPLYNTSNIKIPIALHYGDSDGFAAIKDVEVIDYNLLPNIVEMNKVKNFVHFDFLTSRFALDKVYVKVLENLNNYNRK